MGGQAVLAAATPPSAVLTPPLTQGRRRWRAGRWNGRGRTNGAPVTGVTGAHGHAYKEITFH